MAKEGKRDYCMVCHKIKEYRLQKIVQREWIRGKEYEFEFTIAVCQGCRQEMDVPGMVDLNIRERDEQYRKAEGILSVEEIQKIASICPKKQDRLQHYLAGQVPTKEESDQMRELLGALPV